MNAIYWQKGGITSSYKFITALPKVGNYVSKTNKTQKDRIIQRTVRCLLNGLTANVNTVSIYTNVDLE